jgi:thiamine biosynthesis lipoprotein
VTATMHGPIRHAERVLGTVFAIDVRDPGDWSGVVAEVVAWLRRVDRVFSPSCPEGQIGRLARGELALRDCDPMVREVLATGEKVERFTGGNFTCRPRGVLDPAGIVKGWAVERASDMLTAAGACAHAVSGGGDLQLIGQPAPDEPWRVGISDPREAGALLTVVTGRDLAVATSGAGEHGARIVDPLTGTAPTGLHSITLIGVTPIGPRLTLVDSFATAAFAMGARARAWVEGVDSVEAIGLTSGGQTWISSGFVAAQCHVDTVGRRRDRAGRDPVQLRRDQLARDRLLRDQLGRGRRR